MGIIVQLSGKHSADEISCIIVMDRFQTISDFMRILTCNQTISPAY